MTPEEKQAHGIIVCEQYGWKLSERACAMRSAKGDALVSRKGAANREMWMPGQWSHCVPCRGCEHGQARATRLNIVAPSKLTRSPRLTHPDKSRSRRRKKKR